MIKHSAIINILPDWYALDLYLKSPTQWNNLSIQDYTLILQVMISLFPAIIRVQLQEMA